MMEECFQRTTQICLYGKQMQELTNDVAQVRDLFLSPGAGSVQLGHGQSFQPLQNLDGALKAVHRIDGLPVTNTQSK